MARTGTKATLRGLHGEFEPTRPRLILEPERLEAIQKVIEKAIDKELSFAKPGVDLKETPPDVQHFEGKDGWVIVMREGSSTVLSRDARELSKGGWIIRLDERLPVAYPSDATKQTLELVEKFEALISLRRFISVLIEEAKRPDLNPQMRSFGYLIDGVYAHYTEIKTSDEELKKACKELNNIIAVSTFLHNLLEKETTSDFAKLTKAKATFEELIPHHSELVAGRIPHGTGDSKLGTAARLREVGELLRDGIRKALAEIQASITPRELEVWGVLPSDRPILVGVVKKGVPRDSLAFFRNCDFEDITNSFFGTKHRGDLWYKKTGWNEAHRMIPSELPHEFVFTASLGEEIIKTYRNGGKVRLVVLGIGNAGEVFNVVEYLRGKCSTAEYRRIRTDLEVVGVDKFHEMARFAPSTFARAGIRKYRLLYTDMADITVRESERKTIFTINTNTRGNLTGDERLATVTNIARQMKKEDVLIESRYHKVEGEGMAFETALAYAKHPAIQQTITSAVHDWKNGAQLFVMQYNPHHPEGGNVELFGWFTPENEWKLLFRSVRIDPKILVAQAARIGLRAEFASIGAFHHRAILERKEKEEGMVAIVYRKP